MDPFLPLRGSQSGRALGEAFAPYAQALVGNENFFLTPLNRSWAEVSALGSPAAVFLATRSATETSMRVSNLPMNTDFSRLRPVTLAFEIDSAISYFLLFVGSQVRE